MRTLNALLKNSGLLGKWESASETQTISNSGLELGAKYDPSVSASSSRKRTDPFCGPKGWKLSLLRSVGLDEGWAVPLVL